MIPTQPFNIFAYLGNIEATSLPEGIKSLHYLSWEDAMWDIIKYKKIEDGSVAIVPSFWCGDVFENMRAHGIVCAHYECDENFQTDEKVLVEAIKKYSPKIVIIFHAVGIKNKLLKENINWLKNIRDETIVIEDSVHSIINPGDVKILRPKHFLIDSWRKVMPLQGAAIYGNHEDLFWQKPKVIQSFINKLTVVLLWIVFQVLLFLQYISPDKISIFLGKFAEKCMILGYDFIGDSGQASGTFSVFEKLHKKLDYEKVKKIKREQVLLYEKLLKNIFDSKKTIQRIEYQDSDMRELRGFPVRLSLGVADKILANLRRRGLFVRFELNDSSWSKKQKVIFLPLGPYLREKDINQVTQILMRSTIS